MVAERFRRLRGRRVGLIGNPTSVDARLRHLADLLHQAPDIDLVALFGPEHGARGDAQDMIGVASDVDPATGLPVHSLYGNSVESLAPTPAMLDGIDILLFDVQDVGARYYTFAATMLHAMSACAGCGIDFLVLDRPNPIGGDLIEGPTVDPGYASFVAAHPLPIRHGLTIGELARLFHDELQLDLSLAVIPCEGWTRAMHWPDTGLPWIMPSPNMPTYETALVYPGACLIEATNLSEGRGTTRPFELWGAPWLNPRRRSWEDNPTDALMLRPCAFRPTFHKHAAQVCHGLFPHVVRRETFMPVRCYLGLLAWAYADDPGRFAWRTEPYEFVSDPIAIDLLFGSTRGREAIESGQVVELADAWAAEEAAFAERRRPYLLYPE
jgi:uncharacterized protein YbbC (DUF1343 family)